METVANREQFLKNTREALNGGAWLRAGAKESQQAVEALLLANGWLSVRREVPVSAGPRRHRIDLLAEGPGGLLLALEIDRRTPRLKSLAKLRIASETLGAYTAALVRDPLAWRSLVSEWARPP